MKKLLKNLIPIIIIFLAILILFLQFPLRTRNTVITMKDEKYDDNGAGKIKYPKNLQNEKGLFDIREFTVKNEKNKYIFEYVITTLNNKYNFKNGFSNIMLDTYISTGKKGLTMTSEYGAAVKFSQDYPWKYHIKITPNEYYIEKLENVNTRKITKLKGTLKISGNKILLTIDSKAIPENLKESKYYVFSGGFDLFGSDYYREVTSKENEWNFYGGIDSFYQPNVIDIVSPIQDDMLKYFIPPQYAVLTPIYNQPYQKYILKEYIIILWFLLFVLSIYKTIKKWKNRR